MSINFAFAYAEIDPENNQCIGVFTVSAPIPDEERHECIIPINADDPEYLDKYYINGSWYEDPEGTIPWTSSLL